MSSNFSSSENSTCYLFLVLKFPLVNAMCRLLVVHLLSLEVSNSTTNQKTLNVVEVMALILSLTFLHYYLLRGSLPEPPSSR